MHFHILTLFPETMTSYFESSILGKALHKKIVQIHYHQLRDYSLDKHQSVDDKPYGGGSGMVFRPEVVVNAVRLIKEKFKVDRVYFLSPKGNLLKHNLVVDIAQKYKSILLLCGRYEGVDERALQLVVDEEISIGDYVITGGELAAMVLVDAICRFIPQVLGKEEASVFESHADGLLEHSHYTRPEEFEGLKVPQVLLSGNHAAIQKWRHDESVAITKKRRPELIKK